jgi:imidazolonepropionase-like amidohydrolase
MLATIVLANLLALPLATVTAITNTTVEVGDGSRLERATVVISGDRIVAVGPGVTVPAGATRIDGSGKVLSPGLVAALSQVGLFEVGMEDAYVDTGDKAPIAPAFRVADGYNPLSFHIAVDREEGVTTAILSPSGHQLIAGQAFAVELRTALDAAPDLTRPVAMLGSYDGGVAEQFGGARGSLRLALRNLIDDVRFFKKNRAAFDRAESRPLSVERAHLEAMIPVVDGAIPFVVHADRAADIVALLDLAKAEGLKLIIAGGAESWLVADRLKADRVPVIVVPSITGQKSFDALHARDDLAALLVKAGVDVIISTWDTDNGTTRLRQEAGIAVQNGLAHSDAVKAISQTPARVFGIRHGADSATVGVVAVGSWANLVLWSGDPLEALTIAERIWIAGQPQTQVSRQRLLADKYLRAWRADRKAAATATTADKVSAP